MKKNILVLAGLLSLLGLSATTSQADTIIGVTETHYDANLRPDCVAVRMNPLTFGDAASNACTPKASVGSDGPDRITQKVYDNAGQVLAIYQAVGTSNIRQYAYYNYTPNGLKAFEIDANHNKTTYTYDGFDRLSKIQYPNTTVGNEISSATDYETFGYDANNNRTNWRRRSGATITYFYDNLNRQTHEGGSSSADMDTAYDLQGRIKYKHFSTGGLGVDYAYDGLGRITSTTDMNGRTVAYGYNAASARTGMIYPDSNNLVYSRDYMNRMTNTRWVDGTVMVWQGYNDLGQRRVLDRGAVSGAGGSTAFTYDNLGRLTSLTNNLAATSYDVTWTFTGRNPAGQITTWGNSNSVYDYVEAAVNTDNKTYDGLNRDASIAAVTGGYDPNGNMAKDSARVLTYDFYNRLISVAAPSTPTAPYLTLTYDTEGRLASQTYAGQTTEFLYDGASLIGEYNHVPGTLHNSDTMAARYVHGDGVDEPLVWYTGNSVASPRFFYSNYQGSIVAWTNAAGELQDYFKYDPYGVPYNNVTNTSQQWEGPRFRYTGQAIIKEAQLYYYKARVYDPNMGRFLQTDPVGSKDDLDLYAYVGGDPVNRSDPSGLCANCLKAENDAEQLARSKDQAGCPSPCIVVPLFFASAIRKTVATLNLAIAVVASQSETEEQKPNYVYRGLAQTDNPAMGIKAKNPFGRASMAGHVLDDQDSPWISTSKSLAVAAGKYGRYGVVQIDLNKVPSGYVDISGGIPGSSGAGASGRANKLAIQDQEVLVRSYIPPSAITSVQTFGE